jgi:hypothetical protein
LILFDPHLIYLEQYNYLGIYQNHQDLAYPEIPGFLDFLAILEDLEDLEFLFL